MSKPLQLYTFAPQGAHASYYYRIMLPLDTAAIMGLPLQSHIDTNLDHINANERIDKFAKSDFILMYQPMGDQPVHNIGMAKSFLPSLMNGDGWKYPPTFILDTDDNIFNVNPHNMAFQNLGIKDHAGNLIPPGNTIGCVQEGRKKVLWVDGQNGFDILRNRHNVDTYRQLVNLSDCVTTTTPRNAETVKREADPRRVEVVPNLVRFDHYPQVSLEQDTSRVNILWQGGQAHYEDWYPLREALGEITAKYPQVHWIIWGQLFHFATELIPPERYTHVSWCAYHEYRLRRVMMNDDISLAPLEDNHFNRSRSAIKFYEASVSKKPAATLAQNTGPYADEIVDGETGLLFNDPKEFVEKLSLLIEDSVKRKSLAANAKDWVSENRDAFKYTPKWVAMLERLREEIKFDHPHMPENAWADFVKQQEEQMKAQQEAAEKAKQAQPAPA